MHGAPCYRLHSVNSQLHIVPRLLPLLIQHGSQQPALANLVIAELPAANHCTLQLLLETFHRLSGNAAVNEMDAHTVATVMTPCIAWNPPPKPKVSSAACLHYAVHSRSVSFKLLLVHQISAGLHHPVASTALLGGHEFWQLVWLPVS